jgi:hypothetical protein
VKCSVQTHLIYGLIIVCLSLVISISFVRHQNGVEELETTIARIAEANRILSEQNDRALEHNIRIGEQLDEYRRRIGEAKTIIADITDGAGYIEDGIQQALDTISRIEQLIEVFEDL